MPSDDVSLTCRHLLICQSVWYDPAKPDEFSLGRLVVHARPTTGSYPWRYDRLFLYCQLYGTHGEYQLRFKLVRIEPAEYDEEVEVELGPDGGPLEWPTSRPIVVSEDDYLAQFATAVRNVRLPTPGVYEFQVLVEDDPTPLARERFFAR